MARVTSKISGGLARFHAVEHPYYLKTVPMNPYIGTVHDGVSTEYLTGFLSKHIPFLYRFRHNLFPGMATGFYARNISGKNVHWLEVSTMEKMRVRIFTDEAAPPVLLSLVVILFTIYHCWRLAYAHPDITMYNIVLWTTKPFVEQMRFSKQHPLDKPVYKYIQRVPEFYMEDPIREIARLGVSANDPWLEFCKEKGLMYDYHTTAWSRGWGEAGAGKILPKTKVPFEDKRGHNPAPMK